MPRFLNILFLTLLLLTFTSGIAHAEQIEMQNDEWVNVDAEFMHGPQDFFDTPVRFTFGERIMDMGIGNFLEDGFVRADRVYELVPFITRSARNARVYLDDNGELAISKEGNGMRVNLDALEVQLQDAIDNHDLSPIKVSYDVVPPRVYAHDLEAMLPRLHEIIEEEITLIAKSGDAGNALSDEYTFDVRDHFDALKFEFTNYLEFDGKRVPVSLITKDPFADTVLKKDWVLGIHTQAIDQYIRDNLAADLEIPSSDVTITMKENGRAQFEGTAQNGIIVDRQELVQNMLVALNSTQDVTHSEENNEATVVDRIAIIPLKEVKGKVHAPEELRDRGITELFSIGYSNFRGSPWKRIHNIKTGVSRYDGVFIPKDSVFSFNEHLGAVDAAHGYLEELVILGDETKPEYGGGLCQVSSTFFRAGLFGGLNIAERRAHSYAVSYYARPGGHGLDCTIYLGGPDCKLVNDTPGDLLIQAYTEGNDAYFKFYGTTDGRQVALDGPYYSNHRSAPPDKTIYDPEKPEDYYEEKEHPHNGFDAVWYRTIKKEDGTEYTQTFHSTYQARPKVIIRGGAPPEETIEEIPS